MQIVTTVTALREALLDKEVALVPTMGALHEGHASLIRAASETGMQTVVSVFVNPSQFNDPKDLVNYPRDLAADKMTAEDAGCHVLFAPEVQEMYPPGNATHISVAGLSQLLEGAHRPGHFDGVATVVAKLFLIAQPNIAFFGEKDWQQCRVVARMVEDLRMPVELRFCPTLRESDGLAMSSRNARLSSESRQIAPLLFEELTNAATLLRLHHAVATVEKRSRTKLEKGGFIVDYFSVVNANTMHPATKVDGDVRIVAAATIDGVRLIDNVAV